MYLLVLCYLQPGLNDFKAIHEIVQMQGIFRSLRYLHVTPKTGTVLEGLETLVCGDWPEEIDGRCPDYVAYKPWLSRLPDSFHFRMYSEVRTQPHVPAVYPSLP